MGASRLCWWEGGESGKLHLVKNGGDISCFTNVARDVVDGCRVDMKRFEK